MPLSERLEQLGQLIDRQASDQQTTYEMYKLCYPCESKEDICVQVTAAELGKWFDELAVGS